MNLLTTAIILTAACGMATESPSLDGSELYRCGFELASDRDYDGWPDGWVRQRGPGYPHYVRIQESEEPSAEGEQCLRVDLDGGAAAAFSPPIPIDPRYDYVLEAFIKVEGLKHNDAFFSVRFLDEKENVLETIQSPPLPAHRRLDRAASGTIARVEQRSSPGRDRRSRPTGRGGRSGRPGDVR